MFLMDSRVAWLTDPNQWISFTDGAFHCGVGTHHIQCSTCDMLMPDRSDIDVPQKCISLIWPFFLCLLISGESVLEPGAL